MKGHMQIISGAYFIIVSLGLFLWIHFLGGDILVKHMIPLALGLIVLWFFMIYAVMKRDEKQRNRKEEDKQ